MPPAGTRIGHAAAPARLTGGWSLHRAPRNNKPTMKPQGIERVGAVEIVLHAGGTGDRPDPAETGARPRDVDPALIPLGICAADIEARCLPRRFMRERPARRGCTAWR